MNTDAEMTYMESIQALNQMMSASSNEMASWDDFDYTQIDDIPSNLDGYDYCFSIAIGLAGTFISTSDELAEYLKEIHQVASERGSNPDSLQEFLGNLGNIFKDDFSSLKENKLCNEMINGFKNNKKVHELCKKCKFL